MSAYDEFMYKREIIGILNEVKEMEQGEIYAMTLLALRFMVAEVMNITNPMNFNSEEDMEF